MLCFYTTDRTALCYGFARMLCIFIQQTRLLCVMAVYKCYVFLYDRKDFIVSCLCVCSTCVAPCENGTAFVSSLVCVAVNSLCLYV